MRFIFYIPFLFFLLSCGRTHPNENKINNDYLDKQIADRTKILSHDSVFAPELSEINKNVTNLCLLTIDIENIKASINKSNQYFYEASKQYGVDTSGFVYLFKGVPACDIIPIIKKNHLNLLNKIIIRQNKNGDLMYTAQ
jgi:hypothetical protein